MRTYDIINYIASFGAVFMIEDVAVLYRIPEIILIFIRALKTKPLLLKYTRKGMIVILDSSVCRNGFTF